MSWDIRGKRVLVTGGTSGIGLETSRSLARLGARVVLVGRDPAKTARRLEEIRASAPGAEVSSLLCDFSSQRDVRSLAGEVVRGFDRIEALVNNVGAVFKKRTLTGDGIEKTFAVNHLGHFLFTQLLLERIVRSAPARIVTVASVAHRRATMDFDDLFFEHGYVLMKAYGRSKLANVLYTRLLAQKLAGTGVTANCVHPGGMVNTGIWSGAPAWTQPVLGVLRRFAFIPAEEGARHVVRLVASPELSGTTGQYFEQDRAVSPSRLARDDAVAQRLWEESERLTGLRRSANQPADRREQPSERMT